MRIKAGKFFKVFFYCTGFSSLNLFMQLIAMFPLAVLYIFIKAGPSLLSGDREAILKINPDDITQAILMPTLILAALLTFGVAWLLHAIFKKSFLERLSFVKTPFVLIPVCFLAGCAMQLPLGFILTIMQNAGIAADLFDRYSNLIEPLMANQSLIPRIIAVGIMAPVLEEVIFRGLIFNQLEKNTNVYFALTAQALLFGIVHLNVIQGAYAFVLGLLMGLSFLWSRSLLLPISIHMGMNLSGVFWSEFGDRLSVPAEKMLLIASFILIPACMIFLYAATMRNKKPVINKITDL